MTASSAPSHTDRARALRFVLALLRKDTDVSMMILQELTMLPSQEAINFVVVLGDHTAMLARRRLQDPVGYFESWIALELQLAEDDGNSPEGRTNDV